jgi:hypothetical protein
LPDLTIVEVEKEMPITLQPIAQALFSLVHDE